MCNQERPVFLLQRHEEIVQLFPIQSYQRSCTKPNQSNLPIYLIPSSFGPWPPNDGQSTDRGICRKEMCSLPWASTESTFRVLPCHDFVNHPSNIVNPRKRRQNPSTHRCLFPGSNPTCKTLNACTVQKSNQGWLASWPIYLDGKPWIRFRTRNCMCAFFRRDGGADVDVGSGICFDNTASVSA